MVPAKVRWTKAIPTVKAARWSKVTAPVQWMAKAKVSPNSIPWGKVVRAVNPGSKWAKPAAKPTVKANRWANRALSPDHKVNRRASRDPNPDPRANRANPKAVSPDPKDNRDNPNSRN